MYETLRLGFLAAWIVCGVGLVYLFVRLERALHRERRLHVKYEKLYDAAEEHNLELRGQVMELAAMSKRGDA